MSAETVNTPGFPPIPQPVRACHAWPTNGHLIADVAKLGYVRDTDRVLDVTHGLGVWWSVYRPPDLTAHDLDPAKAPDGVADFRNLPYPKGMFDVVAFDPPYRLRGTPSQGTTDERYGTTESATVPEIMALIRDGFTEAARVVKQRGVVLVKIQDQVVSGRVYWQSDEVTRHADALGFDKIERFDLLGGYRPQPAGRVQVHAHARPSTLLVLRGRRDRPMQERLP